MNELMQQAQIDDPGAEPGVLPPTNELMGPPIETRSPGSSVPDQQMDMPLSQAYDALRTKGAAAYDTMNPIAASMVGRQYVEDRNKRAALELQQMAAVARAGGGAGRAGNGLVPTGVAAKTSNQLIADLVLQKFGVVNTEQDPNAVARAVRMFTDDDKLRLVEMAQNDSALAFNVDKDQPAQAAALQDKARANMLATLKGEYGMSGPDERGTGAKLFDNLVGGIGGVVASGIESFEGIDEVLGGHVADTAIGKGFFNIGDTIGDQSTTPLAREGQIGVQEMVRAGRPMSEILSYIYQNPDLMVSYGSSVVGQLAPFGAVGLTARLGAKALSIGRASTLIRSGALAEDIAVDAKAVQRLAKAREDVSKAINGATLSDESVTALVAEMRAAEAAVAQSAAAGKKTLDVLGGAGKANELLGKARGANAAEALIAKKSLRKMIADDVVDTMTTATVNISTIGYAAAAAAQYGMSMNDVRDSIGRLPATTILGTKDNKALYEKYVEEQILAGASDEEADGAAINAVRRDLTNTAQEAASNKALMSAGITAMPALAAIPGLKSIFSNMGVIENVALGAKGAGGKLIPGIAKGAGFEATQEGIQSGFDTMAANNAALTNPALAKAFNVENEMSGVGANIGIGAALGGVFGGVAGGFQSRGGAQPVEEQPPADTTRTGTRPKGDLPGTQKAPEAAVPGAPAAGVAGAAAVADQNSPEAQAQHVAAQTTVTSVADQVADATDKNTTAFRKKIQHLFGYISGRKLMVPSPAGSKPNAASLHMFSPLWASQIDEDGAPLDFTARDTLFAPYMADGQLADPYLQGLLGEIDAIASAYDPDPMKSNPKVRNAAMADIEARLSSYMLIPKEAPNVQAANPSQPTEPAVSPELGVNPAVAPAESGQQTQERVFRVRNSTGEDAVHTAKEIRAAPDQTFDDSNAAAAAFVRGHSRAGDPLTGGLKIPASLIASVRATLRVYNAALQRGASPAQAAKLITAIPVKGRVTVDRVRTARAALSALPGAPASAVGGASVDDTLGKPQEMRDSASTTSTTPQEDRTLSPLPAPMPGGVGANSASWDDIPSAMGPQIGRAHV